MAREIITLCDPCLAEDVRSVGRTIEVAIEGKARAVELCETHEAELLKPLADVLGRFGQRVTLTAPAGARTSVPRAPRLPVEPGESRRGRQPAGDRAHECIVCAETYASGSGLGKHMHTAHGSDGLRLSAALGDRCPLCGLTTAAKGLGRHTGAIHRLPMAGAFLEARAGGDEFGVVAERIAILTAP